MIIGASTASAVAVTSRAYAKHPRRASLRPSCSELSLFICIESTIDFVLDCLFADSALHNGHDDFFWAAAFFTGVPFLLAACIVTRTLWTERAKLDQAKLTSLDNVFLVLACFTNPEW